MREDVIRYFFPWKALVYSKADGDGRVEMASRCRCGCDDGKCDANGKRPADLEDGAKGGYTDWVFEVDGEGGDGCDAGKAKLRMVRRGKVRGGIGYSYT